MPVKTLDQLPEELVSNIAARLHADDIAALRLTSRSLELKSFHQFATDYFAEKCFMFTTESLKVLVSIAQSKRLRPYFRHVHFMTAIFSARVFECPSGCNCAWQPSTRQRDAFRDYVKDQADLVATGRDKQMLIEAFPNLPNLTTLALDDSPSVLGPDVDYRGSNKVPRLCGRPPMSAPQSASDAGFKEYDTFFRHVWKVLMQTLQHTTALTRFSTHLGKTYNCVPVVLFDSAKFTKSRPALAKLQHLHLRIRSHTRPGVRGDKEVDDVTKRELNILHKFAQSLSSLQSLDFCFDSTSASGSYFISFAVGLKLETLTTLNLDGMSITASALAQIVARLTSIKDVRFMYLNLLKGNWVTILKVLQKMTDHLQHLHLMYLLEGGCRTYFLKQYDEEEDLQTLFAEADAGFYDEDMSDEYCTDDDLPPLEPGEAADTEATTTNTQSGQPMGNTATATGTNNTAYGPHAMPSALTTSTGPTVHWNLDGHSAPHHVRPDDPFPTSERGYYVCVQGEEIAKQLPTFINEYNLGEDGEDDVALPAIPVFAPGTVPTFQNFMDLFSAGAPPGPFGNPMVQVGNSAPPPPPNAAPTEAPQSALAATAPDPAAFLAAQASATTNHGQGGNTSSADTAPTYTPMQFPTEHEEGGLWLDDPDDDHHFYIEDGDDEDDGY